MDKTGKVETLQFLGHEIVIERRLFRRTLSVQVRPGGSIKVKTNALTSSKSIISFLEERSEWLEKAVKKMEKHQEEFLEKELLHDQKFLILGEWLPLRFALTPLKTVFISRSESSLNLHLPEDLYFSATEAELQKYRKKLSDYYKREAIKLIEERIKIWSQSMGLFPLRLQFKNQRSRWGSCTSKGVININWRLFGAPLYVVDYILIHELAHLKHMNHSKAFWDLVEKYCSEVNSAELWLKRHGPHLDFLTQEKWKS